MPVTRHPPHRPVLALLTHTVPTLDVLPEFRVFERKANLGIRMQSLDFSEEMSEFLLKTRPRPAGSLTPPLKLP